MMSRTVKLLCVLPFAMGLGACQRAAGSEDSAGEQARVAAAIASSDNSDHLKFDDDDRDDHDNEGFLPPQPGERARRQKPDHELRDILRAVDRDRLEATVQSLVGFGTRHTLSSQTDPVRGIGAATRFVKQQFDNAAAQSGGRMTVEVQSFVQPPSTRIPNPTTISNVVATLRGTTSPDRIYVISGHLDSRVTDVLNLDANAPGANDDASGVALVIELARVMASHPSDATIVFTAVAGEEQGLFGSAFQAAQYKAAGADIQGMFTCDIVGSSLADDGTRDAHTIRLFTEGVPTAETASQANLRRSIGGEVDGPSRQLGRFALSVAQNEDTDMRIRHIYRRDRFLRGGDHLSYLTQGYPANRFTEPNEDFAHQHQDVRVENNVQIGDLIQFMDFDFLARVTKVNAATMWSLAQGPGTPKNVGVLSQVLSNTTDLVWAANTEPDLDGYEVMWRETTEADWTHVIPVGNVTSASFPHFSKDNVFFGVRAVDKTGHHSPVAIPAPQ